MACYGDGGCVQGEEDDDVSHGGGVVTGAGGGSCRYTVYRD